MSELTEQGGFTANYIENRLQNFVEHTLVEKGYTYIDKSKFKPAIYLE